MQTLCIFSHHFVEFMTKIGQILQVFKPYTFQKDKIQTITLYKYTLYN